LLFTALREQTESHGGQTSHESAVESRGRSVGMRTVAIFSFDSDFLKGAGGANFQDVKRKSRIRSSMA
jgi:hypothetical protein